MLSYEDCIGLSELTQEEIDAIALHEHVPSIVALELGNYLLHSDDGIPMIKRIIVDDIEQARAHGDFRHAAKLRLALRHFVETHPLSQPAPG